jgi:putative radical SAM enzyme (TIGR03279 family)
VSVLIKKVIPDSPADRAGIKSGTKLISIDGNPINDVLDYMFYSDDDMGIEFDTFLMDKKRDCGNNCVFCFIDQNPKGLRSPLYFKDDDSRLSFLQGNYITLTNLTEHDVGRIIKMRTPVNVSVHTTNPDLRAKIMGNPKAGESLETLCRFARAGISMNCQLVLCPEINDGGELIRTLTDLSALERFGSIESIACVPVGLTKFREGLPRLRAFGKQEAAQIIEIVSKFKNVCAADEFYLTAGTDIPEYAHYGTFPQYENGVGMWAHLKHGFADSAAAGRDAHYTPSRRISIVTGTLAFPLISELTAPFGNVRVFAIRNDFFGESVTVSGLLTGGDIIRQLLPQKEELGEKLLIGANMLNSDGVFLDNVTPKEIESALGVRVSAVELNGEALFTAINNC